MFVLSPQTEYGHAAVADVRGVPGDKPARPRRLHHEDHSYPTKYSANQVKMGLMRNFLQKKMSVSETNYISNLSSVCMVCPRRLNPFHIVTYYIRWASQDFLDTQYVKKKILLSSMEHHGTYNKC